MRIAQVIHWLDMKIKNLLMLIILWNTLLPLSASGVMKVVDEYTVHLEKALVQHNVQNIKLYSQALAPLIMKAEVEKTESPTYQGKVLFPIVARKYGFRSTEATDAEKARLYRALDALASAKIFSNEYKAAGLGSFLDKEMGKPQTDNVHFNHCLAAHTYYQSKLDAAGLILLDLFRASTQTQVPYEQSTYNGIIHVQYVAPILRSPSFRTLKTIHPWVKSIYVSAEHKDAPDRPDPSIYNKVAYQYVTKIVSIDGEGDLVHGDRLIRLLPPELPLSRACVEIPGVRDVKEYDAKKYGLNVNKERKADISIVVSHAAKTSEEMYDLFLSEYARNWPGHNYGRIDRIEIHMGLAHRFGYMKPELPINHAKTKEELFNSLSTKWRELIFETKTYADNKILIMAYYSPGKSFPAEALRAFTESKYAKGKKVIYFAKGDKSEIINLKGVIGRLGKVVTTEERIPDDQWHILSQLAEASVATGDSRSSDPFFFRNLSFSNGHKSIELRAWHLEAMQWHAPEGVNKERVVKYIKLLRCHGTRESEFVGFVKTIDKQFMRDWQGFCDYIEWNYTLTPAKLAWVVAVATEIHLNVKEGTQEIENLKSLLAKSLAVLPKEISDFIKLAYDKMRCKEIFLQGAELEAINLRQLTLSGFNETAFQ